MSETWRLPYPGLRAYLRSETDLFFGRDSCTDEMVDRLAETRFLAVLGSSGSGKSSLVRTGLLDALELGFHAAAGSNWRVADFAPGDAPLRNLARAVIQSALAEGEEPDEREVDLLLGQIEHGPRGLAQWAKAGNLAEGENLLLLVDQFEELFRYGDYAAREEAEAFVTLLSESVDSDPAINVVITMRSEFLGACALMPGLVERINRGLYLTRRMTREECREAIEGPAAVVGFTIEPALVTRLLNDLAAFAPWQRDAEVSQLERLSRRADQLPLMQHVLNRLWTRARAESEAVHLTLADYLAVGELRGALDQHGAEILESLGERGEEIAEPVFRGLVAGTTLANAVRRPTRFGELVALTGLPRGDVERVVEAFRAPGCNFLRPPPPVPLEDGTIVDISHESLVRQWSTLAEWLRRETEDGTRWRQLAGEAKAHAEGRADLLSETNLAVASAWLETVHPTAGWTARHGGQAEAVMSFVEDSRQAIAARHAAEERSAGRMRMMRNGLLAVLALLFLGGASAYFTQRQTNELLLATKDQLTTTLGKVEAANVELKATQSDLVTTIYEKDATNRTLDEFSKKSLDLVFDFARVMNEAQDSTVVGFAETEQKLWKLIKPFQGYTLKQGADLLAPEEVMMARYVYGRATDRLGDPSSVKEYEEAYQLARQLLDQAVSPGDMPTPFYQTLFDIVTSHSWNLMSLGDYEEAARVLARIEPVEAALGDGLADPDLLYSLSRVENARARWFDDHDQESDAWQKQQRALDLMERAVAGRPDERRFKQALAVYRTNTATQARNLADAVGESEPQRAEDLRTLADNQDTLACEIVDEVTENELLSVALMASSYANCAERDAARLIEAKEFDAAREELKEAIETVEMLLASDPSISELKFAKLRLLDQHYDVEIGLTYSRVPGTIAAGDKLVDYWIAVMGEGVQLPSNYWVLENTYSTLAGYLMMNGTPNGRKFTAFSAVRAALAPSLAAFPDTSRYLVIDADAAARLADVVRDTDETDPILPQLFDIVITNHRKLGTLTDTDKPSEAAMQICNAYSGKVRFYKELKQPDEMIAAIKPLIGECIPVLDKYPWDFYLRTPIMASQMHAGELLFELGRYEEARPYLEYASHWGTGEATGYLAQMYRLGLSVEKDEAQAAALEGLAGKQTVRRITVPADFNGIKSPFDVYIRQWPDDYPFTGIEGQAKWLSEFRDGTVAPNVITSFGKLHQFARDNDLSFPDLAVYALGATDEGEATKLPQQIAAAAGADFSPTPAISTDAAGFAIRGFDPVSYTTDGGPKQGSTADFVVHGGAIWLFASADNRARFLADPSAYIPAFGGYCTTCLANGQKRHPDPAAFARIDDRTYLFSTPRDASAFRSDPGDPRARAEGNWKQLVNTAVDPGPSPLSITDRAAREQIPVIEAARQAFKGGEFDRSLTLLKQAIADGAGGNDEVRASAAAALGTLSWYALLTGEDDEVTAEAADLAVMLDKTITWPLTNKAHALMFQGKTAAAREIYMRRRGSTTLANDRLWDEVVLEDFDVLRQMGRSAPLMDEISAIFEPVVASDR